MIPRIETITGKKLIGLHKTMSLAENKTAELWRNFMLHRKEIRNNIDTDLYSLQVYRPDHFVNFRPHNEFEKWALTEVADFKDVPAGMETFDLPAGTYAVFNYKGKPSEAAQTFQYIFTNWLPNSAYELDNRPHFEILSEKYKNEHPDSEEEIWIPVKLKADKNK
ncbi:GyrI-like domain-containing protein [Adhaeribacter terreus]|uniref:GyrI-like domain-containing protein n=1 Tax=Adhaeribacter terreus TaxID=529703 RepID=A0ABW0EAL2_9BACT